MSRLYTQLHHPDLTGSVESCSSLSICSLRLPQQPAAPPWCISLCVSVLLCREDRYISACVCPACTTLCLCVCYYLIKACTEASSQIHTACAGFSTVRWFHCTLPSWNCCHAKCSHLVVKHSCGFPLPSGLSTEEPLWCFG